MNGNPADEESVMTKLERRRGEIVQELSRISRNGWQNARPEDYKPLERELHEINVKLSLRAYRKQKGR